MSAIHAVHAGSTAAVRVYRKVSEEFPVTLVTCGVCQGYVLTPTLFNLYFDAMISKCLDNHQMMNRYWSLVSPRIQACWKLQVETLVTNLEYADDMGLLADSWDYIDSGALRTGTQNDVMIYAYNVMHFLSPCTT